MKKCFAISVSKNDSDIIELFCRHVLKFCAGILICDNHSTDATAEILHSLRDEGLPIFFYTEVPDTPGDHEEAILNQMARMAIWEHQADGIIPTMVNQFLVSPGDGEIAAVLQFLRTDTEYHIDSRVGIPSIKNGKAAPSEWDVPGLSIIGSDLFISRKLTVGDGFCHLEGGTGSHRKEKMENLLAVRFPVRSSAQFVVQSVTQWLNCHEKWAQEDMLTVREKLFQLQYEYVKAYCAFSEERLPLLAMIIAEAYFAMSENQPIEFQPLSNARHRVFTEFVIGDDDPIRYIDGMQQTALLSHLFPEMDRLMLHFAKDNDTGKDVLPRFFSRVLRLIRKCAWFR